MVKVNLGGCASFVTEADYKANVDKALAALEVLENETGKGNDFLGWKHLPSETLASGLVAECEAVRDAWKAKNVDLVVVINQSRAHRLFFLQFRPDNCDLRFQ